MVPAAGGVAAAAAAACLLLPLTLRRLLQWESRHLEPGLLARNYALVFLWLQARANRGILYVDEVNLLDDGLVDVVLDSSASGINTVEREGISIAHPAKFIMIGSGNPAVSYTDYLILA